MMFKRSLPILLLLAALTFPSAYGQVTFSASGGFYQHAFSLTLSADEGLSIHYTTDGALPTILSPCYDQPLTLSPSLYSSRDIYLMPDAPEAEWNPPASVRHAIVLRAAAFDGQGTRVGPVATQTYLIANKFKRAISLKPRLIITICSFLSTHQYKWAYTHFPFILLN